MLRTRYGTVLKAFAALDEATRDDLTAGLHNIIARMNKTTDGAMLTPSDYLEVVVTKRW